MPPVRLPMVAALKGYDWPGNVRQLGTVLKRSIVYQEDDFEKLIAEEKSYGLPRRSAGPTGWPEDAAGRLSRSLASGGLLPEDLTDEELTPEDLVVLRDHERAYIRRAYQTCNKNLTRTAQVLGISVNTLKKKLKGK